MQYQLIQDTLTYLMNGVAISGVLAAGTTIVYQYWTQERQLVEGEPLTQEESSQPEPLKSPPSVQQPDLKIELSQLQQQLSFTQEQLEQTQQQLAQSHQHKLQIQSYFDAKLQQAQIELSQLRQQFSSTDEELQKTQQELNSTKEGVQGLVNKMFALDRSAKTRLKALSSNKEVSQQPTFN
jgi:chromosome segregation ATPase